jgi:hypothetical protein
MKCAENVVKPEKTTFRKTRRKVTTNTETNNFKIDPYTGWGSVVVLVSDQMAAPVPQVSTGVLNFMYRSHQHVSTSNAQLMSYYTCLIKVLV